MESKIIRGRYTTAPYARFIYSGILYFFELSLSLNTRAGQESDTLVGGRQIASGGFAVSVIPQMSF